VSGPLLPKLLLDEGEALVYLGIDIFDIFLEAI
jgi:hypothetical protein